MVRSAADGTSRRALLGAYREALANPTSDQAFALRVRIRGSEWPLQLRASDVFTLAEILHEGQYDGAVGLPEQPVIFDAGANVGITGAWFLAHHPGASLHCFEPESGNFELLRANLGGRPDVLLHQVALGEEAGTAMLTVSTHGAMHSLIDASVGDRQIEVPVWRLDDYMAESGVDRVDLLKLDVEGFEMEVLRGFGERLDQVSVICGEVHANVVEPTDFYDLVLGRGFELVSRAPAGNEAENVEIFEVARR